MKHALTSCALIALAAPVAAQTFERGPRNTDFQPAFNEQFRAPLVDSDVALATEELAAGLVHPWGIDLLPGDGGFLVTERPGRLRHVAEDGTLSDPITGVPEVVAERQGGLLDVKIAPDFEESRRIYMTYAKPVGDGMSATAAAYATLSEDMTELSDLTDIFVQSPGSTAPMHFGSRIVFDGEGHVFITTGEHSTREYREYAQDLDKTYGKVIRLTLDGEVPDDNPFVDDAEAVDSIWSYGHRNMQGATMIGDQLWTIEHGPQGGDELNLTEPGLNYGWPVVSYGEQYGGGIIGSGNASAEGMEEPVYFWDPVIAPGDMTVYEGEMFPEWEGDIFIGALVRGGLVRLSLEDGMVMEEESLVRELGRVRDVTVDEDGSLLAITDFENGQIVRITADDS